MEKEMKNLESSEAEKVSGGFYGNIDEVPEKEWICPDCGKKFKARVFEHPLTHTLEGMPRCPECKEKRKK